MTKEKNIPPGYKRSAIGNIPYDWEDLTIGDLISFSGGSQPPLKTFIYEEKEGYVRLIQTRDYRTDKYKTYIPISEMKKSCDKDDIMIGRYGPPIFQIFRGLEGAYNVALIKATPASKIEKNYCYYYLTRPELRNYLEGLSQRSGGQTGIDVDKLNDYPFPLPPPPEQIAIANLLSTWDKAIQTTTALIEQKQNRKKWLMQMLLTGKKRLKGFEKEKWKEYKLKYFIEEFNEKPKPNVDYEVLTSAKRGLIKQTEYYGTNRITSREDADYNVIPPNYITYRSRSDDGLFTFNKNNLGITGLISGYYPVFNIKNGDLDFMLTYLNYFKSKFKKHSIGTSQLVLSLNSLKSASFKLPMCDEQIAISRILINADKEIEIIVSKLERLKQQKKGLMQILLTGKKRLKY